MKTEIMRVLERVSIFEELDPRTLEQLGSMFRGRSYDPGELVFRRGDEGNSMMVVVSGQVKMTSLSSDGRELIINMMGPGEVFGELALLDGHPRSTDAVTVEKSKILSLERRDFVPYLESNRQFTQSVIQLLCSRVRRTTMMTEGALFEDLAIRLLNQVLAWTTAYGERQGSKIIVRHGLTQREIGESIGMTRESVNKQLSHWRRLGLLEVRGRSLVILDLEGLRTSTEQGERYHRRLERGD